MFEKKMIGFILVIVCGALFADAGEFCSDWDTDDFDLDTFYCENGCCGSYGDQYCCLEGQTGMIVGIVIGSIALVAIIVSVLVAIFCCCRKSRGRAGHVNQPGCPSTGVPMNGYQLNTVTVGQANYPVMANYPPAPYITTQSNWQPPPPYEQTIPQSEVKATAPVY